MEVKIFKGQAELLEGIAKCWQDEVLCDFGMELIMEEHLADLQNMIDSPDKELLVLWDKEPVGYMGLTIFKSPLGTELLANEHYWYIVPSKRGGSGAMRLLQFAQQWAKNNKCKGLLMTASKLASNLHDNVCRLYEKLGFDHFETTYIKRV